MLAKRLILAIPLFALPLLGSALPTELVTREDSVVACCANVELVSLISPFLYDYFSAVVLIFFVSRQVLQRAVPSSAC